MNEVSFEQHDGTTPSVVRGGDDAHINLGSNGIKVGEEPHEAGHLMGIADHYNDNGLTGAARRTDPQPGYQGDLMAQIPGTVSARDIAEALSSPINIVNNVPPHP